MVILGADYADDAGVDYHLRADIAWGHLAVKSGSVQGDSEAGRLADGVLFGVAGADAVPRLAAVVMRYRIHFVADLVAVLKTHGRADIAGRDYAPVFDDDATRTPPVTGTAAADYFNYTQKILVPGGSAVRTFVC